MPHALRRLCQISLRLPGLAMIAVLVSCVPVGGEDPFFVRTVEADRDLHGDSGRSVRVGGDHSYPPFEFLDEHGNPDGFNVAVLERVAAIMGLDITVELTEWSEARRRLEDGEIDMLAGMYRTDKRDELHDFTLPFFSASYGLFVPRGSRIHGIEDLDDAVIVVHEGDLAHDFVLAEGLGSEVVAVPEWSDVLAELAAGAGDCAVFGMGQGMREVRRGDYRGIRMVETPLFRRGYAMAVREGNAELLAILNEGLSVLRSTGEFDRIYEEWFGILETGSWWDTRGARTVMMLLAAGTAVAAIAVAWVVLLRRQVHRKTAQLTAALADSRAAQLDLEEANEAKDRFLAKVSHELRTPLHGVIALTRLLERTPLTHEQRPLVQQIDGASGQLFRVLTDLLDVSKARSGELSIRVAPFRIREIVEWLEPTVRAMADDRGLSLDFSYDGPDTSVSGDRERIAQIVINLATNAVKFTPSGTVAVGLTYASAELRIVVQDSGRGIADEERERVFEPFVQAGGGEDDGSGGLGLGLSIVRSLVDRMGGSISVASERGFGTTFTATVPLLEATASERPGPPEEPASEPQRGELSILVAEDDAINRLYLTTFLEGGGATVLAAEDGHQAVQLAQQRVFHVILMDVNMPTMDGLEATKRIRELEANASAATRPIIALTAHAQPDHAKEFLDAGMTGYVSKPFDESQVWNEIDRVLSSEP